MFNKNKKGGVLLLAFIVILIIIATVYVYLPKSQDGAAIAGQASGVGMDGFDNGIVYYGDKVFVGTDHLYFISAQEGNIGGKNLPVLEASAYAEQTNNGWELGEWEVFTILDEKGLASGTPVYTTDYITLRSYRKTFWKSWNWKTKYGNYGVADSDYHPLNERNRYYLIHRTTDENKREKLRFSDEFFLQTPYGRFVIAYDNKEFKANSGNMGPWETLKLYPVQKQEIAKGKKVTPKYVIGKKIGNNNRILN